MLSREQAIRKFNELGAQSQPFYFITDFLGSQTYINDLTASSKLQVAIDQEPRISPSPIELVTHPVDYAEYLRVFNEVQRHIHRGNSFLTNLTFQTPISVDVSLDVIFNSSRAKYKVLFEDLFVCFSPETFVKISETGTISSFPMKGTIDAHMENAETRILNDPKETAEHITIVDLIRNDLSRVATQVHVPEFRFISEVKTNRKQLLQVSSKVAGTLSRNWRKTLGSIIFDLLPAGSISGAPKPKTVDIIQENEHISRGFFTGICGHFDGEKLDSGVMIRFIEKHGHDYFYRSGGGITSFSDPRKEYQEMLDKIYVPVY